MFRSTHTHIALSILLLAAACSPALAIPTNLAPSGLASATTIGFGAVAADGNDGNRNGAFGAGSVFHTADPDLAASWQVDLGANKVLDRIQILPRTDANQNSVENFRIDVFNAANVNVFTKNYLTTSNTGDRNWGTVDVRNVVGSRVSITRLDGSPSFLTFAEFEVFGQDTTVGPNLALGAGLTASSAPGFGSANEDAIDGDINGHFFRPDTNAIGSGGPVYHTSAQGVGQFLRLDLGSEKAIDYINLFSRSDGVTTNNVQVDILAGDGVTSLFTQNVNLNGLDLNALRYDQVIDVPAVQGRFVQVTTLGNEFLAFAEIEVIGEVVPEPASAGLLGLAGLALLSRRAGARRRQQRSQ